ncbi:MAG: carboxypeptidase regulatory-like domain-containing protein [Bryobacterales bacterium]|nr:carboxypeptidase regulatory-like domain-containing protein [Bryobacterales bacterium]
MSAVHTETGVRTAVNTNASGFYSLQALPIGGYTLRVEMNGVQSQILGSKPAYRGKDHRGHASRRPARNEHHGDDRNIRFRQLQHRRPAKLQRRRRARAEPELRHGWRVRANHSIGASTDRDRSSGGEPAGGPCAHQCLFRRIRRHGQRRDCDEHEIGNEPSARQPFLRVSATKK